MAKRKHIQDNKDFQSTMGQALLKVALKSRYKETNIDNLIRVFNATGNPSVAALIVLGEYEEPELPQFSKVSDEKENCVLISFNPFDGQVDYEYTPVNIKRGWFRKDEKNRTKDTLVGTGYWAEDVADKLGIDSEEFENTHERDVYSRELGEKRMTTSVSVETWIRNGYEPTPIEDDTFGGDEEISDADVSAHEISESLEQS